MKRSCRQRRYGMQKRRICQACSKSVLTDGVYWHCVYDCSHHVCDSCFKEAISSIEGILCEIPEGWMRTDADFSGDMSYAEFCAHELGLIWENVELYYYDLLGSVSKMALAAVTGTREEGIWHTSIVTYGKEFYYLNWITEDDPGETEFGTPVKKLLLGKTLWSEQQFRKYAVAELDPMFSRDTYDFLDNNCNHVSDRMSMFLLGRHIPSDVLLLSDRLRKPLTIRAARPVVQRILCPDSDGSPKKPVQGDPPKAGDIVFYDTPSLSSPVVARLEHRAKRDGTCTVSWLTPAGQQQQHTKVPSFRIRRRASSNDENIANNSPLIS